MNINDFTRVRQFNIQKGRETRAMLRDLFDDAPPAMRHKGIGETFDPDQSEVLAHIKSRLCGHAADVSAEAQRLFYLAKTHRVIRFDQVSRTWSVART